MISLKAFFEVWDKLETQNLPGVNIRKGHNIPDWDWDKAWRTIQKERGVNWDKKAAYFLRAHKLKDVVLTDRYSCTIFNESTILVYDSGTSLNEEDVDPDMPLWDEDDLVESQLQ